MFQGGIYSTSNIEKVESVCVSFSFLPDVKKNRCHTVCSSFLREHEWFSVFSTCSMDIHICNAASYSAAVTERLAGYAII